VDPARILHLARLAGLDLTDAECRDLAADLSRLDEFVSRLPSLPADEPDTGGAPPPVAGVTVCPSSAAPGAVPPDEDGLLPVPPPREGEDAEDPA
jgi:hypothetical protein